MRTFWVLALATSVALAGCTLSQGEGGQAGVSNTRDNFVYGVQGAKSGTESHEWENTKGAGVVRLAVQGSGSVRVKMVDAAGETVFDKTLTVLGQAAQEAKSATGKAGKWRLTFTFSNLNGQGAVSVRAVDP
ncbi:MAG TPA: hypothetical protein VNZ52_12770 [Candidatus Thermoplasmatota archaeon]|nr:hypothetical protein [Candidatus Thermoplasmatota archaeon]